ncbi:MAG: D-tyrosyl-tRNA(Tyr) deacylase [Clostridia bacterium]|nr:D-tyrosyl-tRNA(Tyr) deacylase [Clostridia bacterium]
MRAVIQRVQQASVTIGGNIYTRIGAGLLILLGMEAADADEDIEWLSGKIARLRIFDDAEGVMNKSVMDINGEVLVVSQFTLHASTKKGNRPSYIKAARPESAIPLYEKFVTQISRDTGKAAATGEFGANMQIALINNGPVTLIIDTKNRD